MPSLYNEYEVGRTVSYFEIYFVTNDRLYSMYHVESFSLQIDRKEVKLLLLLLSIFSDI